MENAIDELAQVFEVGQNLALFHEEQSKESRDFLKKVKKRVERRVSKRKRKQTKFFEQRENSISEEF